MSVCLRNFGENKLTLFFFFFFFFFFGFDIIAVVYFLTDNTTMLWYVISYYNSVRYLIFVKLHFYMIFSNTFGDFLVIVLSFSPFFGPLINRVVFSGYVQFSVP